MNTVRVVTPPALIERGKALQYANREALGSRFLAQKVKTEANRRRRLHQRQDPSNLQKAGGKLEFAQPKTYPIWKRRRSYLIPSYFLRPQGDYDQQGRLLVDSSTDNEKFTVPKTISPLEPTGDGRFIDRNTTFKIQDNTLSCSPRLIDPRFFSIEEDTFLTTADLSYLATDSQVLQPDSLDCTLETFIELPDIERQAIIEQLDLNIYDLPYYPPTPPPYNIAYFVTSYSSFLSILGPHFGIEITKNVDTVIAPGYPPTSSMIGPWRANVFRRGPLQPFENIILGTSMPMTHLAITYSNSKISVYLGGQRLAHIDHFPTRFGPRIFGVSMFARSEFGLHLLLPPNGSYGYSGLGAPFFDVPFKLSRFRLTLNSIYSGDSFVPPSTINSVY